MAGGLTAAPWEAWWVDLDPQLGREQSGLRPAIVVGSEFACTRRNNLALVVPCSTTDRGLPWRPPVVLYGRAGVALCDHIKSLDLVRLVRRHRAGVLDPAYRAAIADVLRRMLATP